MEASVLGELARRCDQMNDARRHNRRHPLVVIVTTAVVAVMCGADGWDAVARFAKAEAKWFGLFLPLQAGIPSRQTFERVFALLKPEQMENCLKDWFTLMSQHCGGAIKQVAIDGKALRHSYQHAWDSSSMAYLVSAFANENGLVMAQTEAAGKGGELEGIKRLLEVVDLKERMVTIDALGCQREIAATIRQKGGDYCLAVKDNQPTLYAKVSALLDEGMLEGFAGWDAQTHQSTNGGHGRIETRTVWVTTEVQHLGDLQQQWPGLAAIAVVESRRTVISKQSTKTRRYYILSRALSAADVQTVVRSHWGIENKLHYVLDVSYGEDASRIRAGSATHFSRLRRLTLNMLRMEASVKDSLPGKRQMCGWNREYRLKVLAAGLAMAPVS